MDNQSPKNPEDSNTTPDTKPSSLLDEIIQTSHESNVQPSTDANIVNWSPEGPTPNINATAKKTRDPLTASTILKLIGSFLLIAIIFFGSFLAYIAFNPDQASFFVNFGINRNDIQALLKKLINGSFGITVLIFSIVWIISLFKAIWTPRDQKRKRLLGWLTATIIGILLFSIITFWAFLFQIINATDYSNTDGEVMIYDNDLYIHAEWRDDAQIYSTNNLIGPITLKYDLSANAKAIAKKSLLSIESYSIDFDDAKCINNQSTIKGSNPINDQGIICTFDQIRTYNIRWNYTGKNTLGEVVTITIPLSTVEIKGLLDISTTINKDKKKVITFNASKVKNLGIPRWVYSTDPSVEITNSSITEQITSAPILVCLKVIDESCDRIFIIKDLDGNETDIVWSIIYEQDPSNSLWVILSLSGVNISQNEITNIDWIEWNGTRLCEGTKDMCEYTFNSYGTKSVTANIILANKKTYQIQSTFSLSEPLVLIRHAQVRDQDNIVLNTPETFDPAVGGFVINSISAPATLTLDARDIILENPWYNLKGVTWKISDGKKIEEKVWEKVTAEILKSQRYTINVLYTFEKNIATNSNNTRIARDTIILDLDRKSLEPVMIIQKSSDYTPAKITVDASTSQSKNGTIDKFIFDFGEGRPPAEGDAIQVYEYRTPGEKKITLTIIGSNNEQATTSKYIVLKDTPKNISFTTSMSPGVINTPVDFTADGTTGQIEEWIWNFGDGTEIAKWYEATHTYMKAGIYKVRLTVRYLDGTEKSTEQNFSVDQSLE